jgi:hypothetical protein
MALSRVKTWSAAEILSASDLNAEFNNFINNAATLIAGISPSFAALTVTGAAVMNEAGGDDNFRVETENNVNALFVDAGLQTGEGVIGIGSAPTDGLGILQIEPSSLSMKAATSFGLLRIANTNAITVPAGTTAVAAGVYLEAPNLTATGTITASATLYIEGAATEGTNDYAIWVDAGSVLLDGALTVGGNVSLDGGTFVYNEAGADLDARFEGSSNNRVLNLDAGENALSFGGGNVDGAANIFNNIEKRTAITSVGTQIHKPVQTQNFDNSSGTIAIGVEAFFGIPTFTNDNATLTMTNSATVYIQGAPVAGSNVAHTTAGYSLWVDAGNVRFDGASTLSGTVTGPSGTWDSGGMDIATSDTYAIDGTNVLNATTLGTAVVNSSLTSVGTITTGVWGGTDITVANGGTGVSTLTSGGILLGSGADPITAMAVLANSEMIVGDGTTDPVAESGVTLRESIGLETGTFTPGVAFGGNAVSVTYSQQGGFYWKFGDLVHIQGRVTLTSNGSSTGAVTFTGIPYETDSGAGNRAVATISQLYNIDINTGGNFHSVTLSFGDAATTGQFYEEIDNGNPVTLTEADFADNADFRYAMTYISRTP